MSHICVDRVYMYTSQTSHITYRPRTEKSHSKRHELLLPRTAKLNYPAFTGETTKNPAKEEFVAFQVRFLHSWAVCVVRVYMCSSQMVHITCTCKACHITHNIFTSHIYLSLAPKHADLEIDEPCECIARAAGPSLLMYHVFICVHDSFTCVT